MRARQLRAMVRADGFSARRTRASARCLASARRPTGRARARPAHVRGGARWAAMTLKFGRNRRTTFASSVPLRSERDFPPPTSYRIRGPLRVAAASPRGRDRRSTPACRFRRAPRGSSPHGRRFAARHRSRSGCSRPRACGLRAAAAGVRRRARPRHRPPDRALRAASSRPTSPASPRPARCSTSSTSIPPRPARAARRCCAACCRARACRGCNPAVDVCNLCSLEHQLPLGLYDRDLVRGAVRGPGRPRGRGLSAASASSASTSPAGCCWPTTTARSARPTSDSAAHRGHRRAPATCWSWCSARPSAGGPDLSAGARAHRRACSPATAGPAWSRCGSSSSGRGVLAGIPVTTGPGPRRQTPDASRGPWPRHSSRSGLTLASGAGRSSCAACRPRPGCQVVPSELRTGGRSCAGPCVARPARAGRRRVRPRARSDIGIGAFGGMSIPIVQDRLRPRAPTFGVRVPVRVCCRWLHDRAVLRQLGRSGDAEEDFGGPITYTRDGGEVTRASGRTPCFDVRGAEPGRATLLSRSSGLGSHTLDAATAPMTSTTSAYNFGLGTRLRRRCRSSRSTCAASSTSIVDRRHLAQVRTTSTLRRDLGSCFSRHSR